MSDQLQQHSFNNVPQFKTARWSPSAPWRYLEISDVSGEIVFAYDRDPAQSLGGAGGGLDLDGYDGSAANGSRRLFDAGSVNSRAVFVNGQNTEGSSGWYARLRVDIEPLISNDSGAIGVYGGDIPNQSITAVGVQGVIGARPILVGPTAVSGILPTGGVLPVYTTQLPITGLLVADVYTAVAPGVNTTVITAVAGQKITIYGWDLSIAASGTPPVAGLYMGVFTDTAGGTPFGRKLLEIGTAIGANGVTGSVPVPPGGFSLPTGLGLRLFNSGGSAGSLQMGGSVVYTQA